MKKLVFLLLITIFAGSIFADSTGIYLGGGVGYGYEDISTAGVVSPSQNTTTIRAFVGYQLFSMLGIEGGYTYFTPGTNWDNMGQPSATIYDLSITPGYEIPMTQITVFGRLGLDATTAAFNDNWTNQLTPGTHYNFEWGGGLKFSLPITGLFVRAEYINYGSGTTMSNNTNVTIAPSTLLLDVGYVF